MNLSSHDWFIGLLDIVTALGESDVEEGIDRVPRDEGLLDSR